MAGNRIIRFLKLMVGSIDVGSELADTILHKADSGKHREINDAGNSAIELFSSEYIFTHYSPLIDYSGANMEDYSLPPKKFDSTGTLGSAQDGYVSTYNHATGMVDWQDMSGVVGADTYQIRWDAGDIVGFLDTKIPGPSTSSGNEMLKINSAGNAYELGAPVESPAGAGDAHKLWAANALGDGVELISVGDDLEYDVASSTFRVIQTGATHEHAMSTVVQAALDLKVDKSGLDADLSLNGNILSFSSDAASSKIELAYSSITLSTVAGDSVYKLSSDAEQLDFSGAGSMMSTVYSNGILHMTTTYYGTGEVGYLYEDGLTVTARSILFDSQSGGFNFYYDASTPATTAGLTINSQFVGPITDNITSLGSTSNRWTEVCAVNNLIQTSDETLKVISKVGDCSWLYNLTPISYRWKDNPADVHYGFTAQDIFAKSPKKDTFCVRQPKTRKDGKQSYWGTSPTEFIAPMMQLLKEQHEKIIDLEARLTKLGG